METDGDARCVVAGDGDVDGTALLAEFRTWLSRERGLSPVSVRCYVQQARAFLAALPGAPEEAVRGLDAGQVTAFMVGYSRDRNRWSAKAMVTSLRGFLRFAHASGRTGVPLAGAVPAVASWRLAALPRGMAAAEVERLLPVVIGTHPSAAAITRSCRCWPGSGCAAPRPPACNWTTLTGGPARLRSAVRAAVSSGSHCRSRPGRRLPSG
jgi:hypothetical protein